MTSTLILDFSSLVSDRSLTPDVMTRVLTMGIGALWRVRMIRDTKKEREKEKDKEGKVSAEPRVASHLLQLMTALLRIGILQISDGSDAGDRDGSDSNNLAMNITAVFRRVLPVLRICSKWTRAHLSYLISLFPPGGHGPKELVTAIKDFWIAYQGFFTNLGKAFPSTDVPTLTGPLEEDVDMNGFVPLKKTMVAAFPKSSNGLALEQSRVHPNEEHLMRISDLLQDAREVAADEVRGHSFSHGLMFLMEAYRSPQFIFRIGNLVSKPRNCPNPNQLFPLRK
jgi:protein SMG7